MWNTQKSGEDNAMSRAERCIKVQRWKTTKKKIGSRCTNPLSSNLSKRRCQDASKQLIRQSLLGWKNFRPCPDCILKSVRQSKMHCAVYTFWNERTHGLRQNTNASQWRSPSKMFALSVPPSSG